MQNFLPKVGSRYVTVYFPNVIVIVIRDILECISVSIGKYTVLVKVDTPHGGDPTFGQEVLHL